MLTRLRAFSIVELMVTIALFSVLSLVLMAVLQMVSKIWYRANGRDDALTQVTQAKAMLARDLANSSQQSGQWATAHVSAHLTGFDGDAITFLSSDSGTGSSTWSADPTTGECTPAKEVTYYLVIPNTTLPVACTGAADANGYEDQCPFKWLIRRLDPVTGTPPAVPPTATWTAWLTQPTAIMATPTQQVVANQLFQFRVLSTPPTWVIQISAVSVSDAMRQIAVGTVPLVGSKFTVTEQFGVPANN